MNSAHGAVACGHELTLEAATESLRAGGNAFDAAIAALWAACVAEPLLASPGGGGFLLAQPAGRRPRIYDFFTHTPGRSRPPEIADFREVTLDFGSAQQAFHIGLGSAAVPGTVAGAFRVQRELGRMSMAEVVQPALKAAREGVEVTRLQANLVSVLVPILEDTEAVRKLFQMRGRFLSEGDRFRPTELGSFLEVLVAEGEELFYRGEVAESVDRVFRDGGGHLRRADFEGYEVVIREPLEVTYGDRRIWTNPPPSSGGLLVAFGLRILDGVAPVESPWGPDGVRRTVLALSAMRDIRIAESLTEGVDSEMARRVLSPDVLEPYREVSRSSWRGRGGTTHISIVDRAGNAAALSVSNGEGCGWKVPGTGFMLNNMLGESDLQPGGLGRWPTGIRLTSMMAPTFMRGPDPDRLVALGSGGSNRIRSAVLQVLLGLADFDLTPEDAVACPRLHVEGDRLEIEGGFDQGAVRALARDWHDHRHWPDRNLFFGGVHVVESGPGGTSAAGDPRRGGAALVV